MRRQPSDPFLLQTTAMLAVLLVLYAVGGQEAMASTLLMAR